MKLIEISFLVLLVFSVGGVVILTALLHENIHKLEFSNLNKTSDYICYLGVKDSGVIGFYALTYDTTNSTLKMVQEKDSKNAELYAYMGTGFVMLIWVVALIIFVREEFKRDR